MEGDRGNVACQQADGHELKKERSDVTHQAGLVSRAFPAEDGRGNCREVRPEFIANDFAHRWEAKQKQSR